jgi:hypothetical protein
LVWAATNQVNPSNNLTTCVWQPHVANVFVAATHIRHPEVSALATISGKLYFAACFVVGKLLDN